MRVVPSVSISRLDQVFSLVGKVFPVHRGDFYRHCGKHLMDSLFLEPVTRFVWRALFVCFRVFGVVFVVECGWVGLRFVVLTCFCFSFSFWRLLWLLIG